MKGKSGRRDWKNEARGARMKLVFLPSIETRMYVGVPDNDKSEYETNNLKLKLTTLILAKIINESLIIKDGFFDMPIYLSIHNEQLVVEITDMKTQLSMPMADVERIVGNLKCLKN
jgi:hypothetical protein